MDNELAKKYIAVLMSDGFEQIEFTDPYRELRSAGAKVTIISPKGGAIKAWQRDNWGESFESDIELGAANPDDYDALLLPGGVMNPDNMRGNAECVAFIKHFIEAKKPLAAICHAPQLLTETGLIDGIKLTSYPSVKTDLIHAGAHWVDEEVVVDQGIVTSRRPDDLPAFIAKMIEEFSEGRHLARETA